MQTRNLHLSSKNSKKTIKKSVFEDFYGFSTLHPRGLPSESEKSSIKNAENVKNYGSTACDRAERLASGGGRQE